MRISNGNVMITMVLLPNLELNKFWKKYSLFISYKTSWIKAQIDFENDHIFIVLYLKKISYLSDRKPNERTPNKYPAIKTDSATAINHSSSQIKSDYN